MLLSALLVFLALILVEHVWVYSGAYRSFPHLLGFSFPGLIALSPLYYCYAHALLQEKLNRRFALHFLPSIFIIISAIPWAFTNGETKIESIALAISSGLLLFPTHASLVVTAIGIHMLAYFYITYIVVEKYEEKVKEESADAGVLSIHWLKQLSFSFCLFAVLFYLTALKYLMFPSQQDLLPNLFVFGIAVFIFVLAYYTYRLPDLFALYQPGTLPSATELAEKPKYQNTMLAPALLDQYKQQLLDAMEKQKPYLDGELRLGQLAESLGIPAHHLSQVINVAFEVSFFDFINQYRAGYAQQLLRQRGSSGNILDIALQSGFNSKASFNRVFKRETGMTPSQFLANQEK